MDCLCGRKIKTEQVLGRSRFTITYSGNENFFQHERVQLSSGRVLGFLNMNFLMEEACEEVYYDFTNCMTLKAYIGSFKDSRCSRLPNEKDTVELLRILMEVLTTIEDGEDFLLYFYAYELEVDAIYIEALERKPLICYIPILERKTMQPMERIMNFLNQVGQLSENQTFQGILQNIIEKIEGENIGILGTIHLLGTSRRDLAIALT
ncbi:MAG: DUF6382 domain-containing protein [Acetivibrio sp.]